MSPDKRNRPPRPKRERKPMPPGHELARKPKATPSVPLPEAATGRSIVVTSWVAAVVAAVATVPAALRPHTLGIVALVADLALFFGGMAVFAYAYLVALGRSREVEITLPGLFGLAGSAPAAVRVQLFAAMAAQEAVGIAGAGVRPYTSLAFGALDGMWGLGLVTLWGARHGAFAPRRGRPA